MRTGLNRGAPAIAAAMIMTLAAGCGSTPPSSTQAGGASRAAAATASAAPSSKNAAPEATAATCPLDDVGANHQAPELEAQLPRSVQGRSLVIWSLRGLCVFDLVTSGTPGGRQLLLDGLFGPGSSIPVKLDEIAYAVAGRATTTTDPPHFVFAANRPDGEDEIDINLFFLLAGAGFDDIAGAANLDGFTETKIAGRQVWVGAPAMVTQDQHQQGTPYLYQTDSTMFLVVGAPEWATEAIGLLPEG